MMFRAALALADSKLLDVVGETSVTYTPSAGASVTVRGVFSAVATVEDLGEPGVVMTGPVAFLRLSDLPSDPVTDMRATVSFDSIVYRAHTVKIDGVGGVSLFLTRVE